MSDSYYDLEALKTTGENFYPALQSLPKNLPEDDAPEAFSLLFQHFDDTEGDPKVGKSILLTIRKLIQRPEILEIFSDEQKNYFLELPYDLHQFTDDVYAIIYDVLRLKPNLLNTDFVSKMKFLYSLKDDPHKALSIIAAVAQKYIDDEDDLEDPWPVMDLIIYHTKEFAAPELLPHLLSLFVYLNQQSEEYRKNRIEKCWLKVVSLLDIVQESNLRPVYTALCYLRDEFKKTKGIKGPVLPYKTIIDQLHIQDIQGPALALLVDEERPSASKDFMENVDELIEKLFEVAENDRNLKATIVLMRLAEDQKIAEKVLGSGNWLLKKLPEAVDTLRLFLVIFKHNQFRTKCAECQQFIPFLKFVIEELGSSGVITITCTIIRRIPLDEKFIKDMADQGLVETFIKMAKETDDETKVSSHSLLLFLNTIAEYTYLDEYLDMVQIVVDKTTNDPNLCEIASYVAVTFAKYDKCLQKMVSLKLDDFFREKKSDKKYKRLAKNADKFLKLVS